MSLDIDANDSDDDGDDVDVDDENNHNIVCGNEGDDVERWWRSGWSSYASSLWWLSEA